MQKENLSNKLLNSEIKMNYSRDALNIVFDAIYDIKKKDISIDELRSYVEDQLIGDVAIIYYNDAFHYLMEIQQYNFEEAIEFDIKDICGIASYYLNIEILELVDELFKEEA